MSRFDLALQLVLKHEGMTFVDNPNDEGGASRFGISLRFYKTIKPDATIDDIRNLSVATVENIYKTQFWDKNRYSELDNQKLANRMLDLCVNTGARNANICLQQAINSCVGNLVEPDGVIGIRTIAAANGQPQDKLYNFLIEMATLHYEDIAKLNNNDVFLKPWLARLTDTP